VLLLVLCAGFIVFKFDILYIGVVGSGRGLAPARGHIHYYVTVKLSRGSRQFVWLKPLSRGPMQRRHDQDPIEKG
jgi:hypothetical protein